MFITSLEVFGDQIYFGENSTSSIRTCDKVNCHEPLVYRKNTPNVRQLKILALSETSDDSVDVNGCYLHQQGKERKCDHLCIPKGKFSFVCKCAIGYKTDPKDSSKYIGTDDVLIYSLGYELKGMSLGNDTDRELLRRRRPQRLHLHRRQRARRDSEDQERRLRPQDDPDVVGELRPESQRLAGRHRHRLDCAEYLLDGSEARADRSVSP